MSLPPDLIAVINEARTEIEENKNGELILPLRRKIWLCFGMFEKISPFGSKCKVTIGITGSPNIHKS